MSKRKPTLSVVIITKNEADRLPRLLESIRDIADEIIVVDSGSTDGTPTIAARYGAKVFIEEWKGYGRQKQSALEKAKGDWILFLDADEIPDERLKQTIREVIKTPSAKGYLIRRKVVYLGKITTHVWGRDWVLRLVKRDANPRWIGDIHEKLLVEGRVEKLRKGVLYHYPYRNLKEHYQKLVKYAETWAEIKAKEGKTPSLWKIIFAPLGGFFKYYILNRGFLDGFRGFVISVLHGFYTFSKYLFLWERSKKKD